MRMKLGILCLLMSLSTLCSAQEQGHYEAGSFPIRMLHELPPPGVYLTQIFSSYSSNTLKDDNGRTISGIDLPGARVNLDLNLDVFSSSSFLIFMSEEKVLGADYGAGLLVPLANARTAATLSLAERFGREATSNTGLADVLIYPAMLGWHGERFDAWAGYGVFAPTGRYSDGSPENVGLGFWSHLFQGGAGYYFDDEKSLALTALGTYEINTSKSDVDLRPGDTFTLEYGLSKMVSPNLELGLAGYSQWQVSRDSGSAITYDPRVRDQVHALGGQVSWTFPESGMNIAVRHMREFGAIDRFQGHSTHLTLAVPLSVGGGE